MILNSKIFYFFYNISQRSVTNSSLIECLIYSHRRAVMSLIHIHITLHKPILFSLTYNYKITHK